MKTIGPWTIDRDGGCRMATYHEESPGQSMSGTVVERRPWFGLQLAEQSRHEVRQRLEREAEQLKELNDEGLYDYYGEPVAIVSRTAKTITVTNRWEETYRVPLSKFKDGEAYHGRCSFTWGSLVRSRLQRSVAELEQSVAQSEAECAKWQQRVQNDPEGWYGD